MGQRPYPAISITIPDVTFSEAEVALNELSELENFQQTNNESKFERKTSNGNTEVSGYIKRSLTYNGDECSFSIHPSFTTRDSQLTVEFTDSMTESTTRFNNVSTVFDKIIYPLLEEYLTDVPEPQVTTKSI